MEISLESLYDLYLKSNQEVCTDTRKLVKGALFFALKGPNFDANELAAKAIIDGCRYAIVDEEKYADNKTVFFVKDALIALQALARFHREQFKIPVLAITGSNAKTTHKELINAVLSTQLNTLFTIGNLNNHIGVPLTLLRLKKEHQFAIIEMGANHQGEIKELCEIAKPTFGLITNIGKAHLEGFGGIEGIKKGKGEMYQYIVNHHGKIFVNGDDDVLHEMAKSCDKITYGVTKLFDVIGKSFAAENVKFKWTTRYGEKDWNKLPEIQTHITGSYNFINCLAAVCVGHYFGISDQNINRALSEYVPEMNRSQLVKKGTNTIILDAYNANPNSMQVAINNLSSAEANIKYAYLGDMFELGEYSDAEHKAIIELCEQKKFDFVCLVGKAFTKNNKNFTCFETTDACMVYVKSHKPENALILIKGSRSMKMEKLLDVL